MDILVITILSIVAGILLATIAASGVYYVFKTKQDKKLTSQKDGVKKKKIVLPHDDSYVIYQDESMVDIESVAVQPETKRPILSPDDVYPPVKEEVQDDFLLESLEMDYSSSGGMPPDEMVERRGSLEFLLHFYQLSSTLTLTLVRLADLPRRLDTNNPPDPVIELEVKYSHDSKVRSEIYQKTCNPHMYESFRFEITVNDLGNQTLCFRVIDMMQTGIPEPKPPTPPPPQKGKKRREPPPPPLPPPPPPLPALIGIVTVPLASVPMKKLLSDTEITIVRDIIKLRRKRQLVDIVDAPAGDTILSTTTEEEGPDTADTEEVMTADSSADPSEIAGFDDLEKVEDEQMSTISEEVPLVRPSVSFATEEPDQTGQMLLVSMAYWKPSEKLTVVIMKGRNLKLIDKNRKPDPFVKVYIMMGAKRLKKKRTVLKRREVNPVWNEAFSFNIPNRILHRVSVMILVKHHSERGRERIIGKLMIGASSTDEAVDHWNAMSATGKSVARWHHLIEEK